MKHRPGSEDAMRKFVALLFVVWAVWPNQVRAQASYGTVKPGPPSDSAATPGSNTSAASSATSDLGDPQDWPWNPDVLHANVWPYLKPVHIESGYFGPPGEFWLRGDYLLWSMKGERLPPLMTSGTATLFGGSNVDEGAFSGGRFEGGVWFDSDYTCGFQGNYFFLAEKSTRFQAGPGSFDLAEGAFTLASPGGALGSVSDQVRNDLQGGEANLVWNVRRKYPWTIDVIGGFRYLNLDGSVNLASETIPLLVGTTTAFQDLFSVHNHFYGGQLGGRVEYRWGRLVLDLTEKLALGGNTSDIAISGYSLQTAATAPPVKGFTGLLAQRSNIGHHSDDSFAVVNELALRAGWQFCDYFQAFVGYTFLYSSSVVRPGDVIDVRQAQPLYPAFLPRETDFWAQGLNAGIEIRY
jgi:hypothetical protein